MTEQWDSAAETPVPGQSSLLEVLENGITTNSAWTWDYWLQAFQSDRGSLGVEHEVMFLRDYIESLMGWDSNNVNQRETLKKYFPGGDVPIEWPSDSLSDDMDEDLLVVALITGPRIPIERKVVDGLFLKAWESTMRPFLA
ncbi:MAG: hypothetical protein H0T78_05635, partial [Longispora sp.]|nr:hypothetical protein [Longispora sp. (in: high G+C Gram-positive bacteria)]